MTGRIHSRESFGTVDGPGIRYVLFMQGCPLRCLYCHNPDTWDSNGGTEITAEEVITEYLRNKSFYAKGGITVTGGEPLMQIEFLTELFTLAKKNGIHTCIDTSGITFNGKSTEYLEKLDRLLLLTDLVMLDIKHIDTKEHKKMTGAHNTSIIEFAKYLDKKNISIWIRHIIIPGLTDSPKDLANLGEFIGTLKNLHALDVLPYHTMGVHKYAELGMEYPLKNVEAVSVKEAEKAKSYIIDGIKKVRAN